jgi:hypothetical protein
LGAHRRRDAADQIKVAPSLANARGLHPPWAVRNEILEPFVEAVAFRQHLPVLGHLQKISLYLWVGSGICPRSTSSRSFKTLSLLFSQFLKRGTPHRTHGRLTSATHNAETSLWFRRIARNKVDKSDWTSPHASQRGTNNALATLPCIMGDGQDVGNGHRSFAKRIGLVILVAAMVAVLLLLTSQFVGL